MFEPTELEKFKMACAHFWWHVLAYAEDDPENVVRLALGTLGKDEPHPRELDMVEWFIAEFGDDMDPYQDIIGVQASQLMDKARAIISPLPGYPPNEAEMVFAYGCGIYLGIEESHTHAIIVDWMVMEDLDDRDNAVINAEADVWMKTRRQKAEEMAKWLKEMEPKEEEE